MRNPIHLHTLDHLNVNVPAKRLNLFAGRAMSEAAFDLTQNYVADRVSPLLAGVWPGIQQGLEVEFLSRQAQLGSETSRNFTAGQLTKMAYASHSPAYPVDELMPGFNQLKARYFSTDDSIDDEPISETEETDVEALFRIKTGTAVTASGTVVKLFNPLEMKWSDLLARSNYANNTTLSGLFMLSLGTEVIPVDYDESTACRRFELDPVRDARFETVAYLQLLPVKNFLYEGTELLKRDRHKIINRFLSQLIVGPQKPELPMTFTTLGLVSVNRQKPLWFESLGCRFLSHPQSFSMALLAHTEQVFSEMVEGRKNIVRESKNTFQALPTAGSLPRSLLSNVANIDAPLPKFRIDYPGLRVDMMPIPASGVAGVLRRELSRGVVKFSADSEERLRLLIALPDAQYQPDLLDVPVSDKALSAQLYDYGIQSYDAWFNWYLQLEKLFSQTYDAAYNAELGDTKLSSEELTELGLADLTEVEFNAPLLAATFFDELIAKRKAALKIRNNNLLPPPYREGVPDNEDYDLWLENSGPNRTEPSNDENPGLIIKRAEIEKDITLRTEELASSRDYVEKINDLLLLQRQQLDVQSVSFATFAGGVAGDGSGLQLTRWLPYVNLNTDQNLAQIKTSTAALKISGAPETLDEQKLADVKVNAGARSATGAQASIGGSSVSIESLRSGIDTNRYVAQPNFTYNIGSNYSPEILTDFRVDSRFNNDFNIGTSPSVQSPYKNLAQQSVTTSQYESLNALRQNVSKLDQVQLKTTPLSAGYFQTANKNFGVLEHVSVLNKELNNSHSAVTELQKDIDDIVEEINAFILALPDDIKSKSSIPVRPIFFSLARRALPSLTVSDDPDRYKALFDTGKSLIKEITEVERLRIELIRLQKVLQKYILQKKVTLKKADREISVARKELTQLDAQRREALEDYTVAQTLLVEHWQAVEEKFQHRNKVLNGMLGLYYVKVRETATSIALPNVHSLGYAEVGDLVPGCRSDEPVNLPDELVFFMDAVLDISMEHWQALSKHTCQLPGRLRLLDMLDRRTPRIQSKQSQLSRNINSRIRGFSELRRQTLFVYQRFSTRRYTNVRSLKYLQYEAAKVLSLEDLLNNSAGGRLRKYAQQLSNNLQLASFCLLEKLNELPPSIRLVWGQLAEDDQLPIDHPEKWPEIEKAEEAAFNSLRTTLELVRWFNRQLSSRANGKDGGDSRTALRNLVRACLMLAASDDPGDILEGQLQVSPGILQLGSVLRLSLNQEAVPGATLQLLDENKKAVAMLRLDDQDNEGASATIVNLFAAHSAVNTRQYRVIGHKYK